MNVVLQGISNSTNADIYNIGMNIYKLQIFKFQPMIPGFIPTSVPTSAPTQGVTPKFKPQTSYY